ncbi:MAG: cell division protein FtsL [Aeromonadales bacterium]|jgi:cell division protein FtsL|nr:cell division protein FtsL [Aeromonadales bacterium]MDY2891930.1 cell division protein FtsL [Succinivibrio sp.]
MQSAAAREIVFDDEDGIQAGSSEGREESTPEEGAKARKVVEIGAGADSTAPITGLEQGAPVAVRHPALVPCILKDMARNSLVWILALAACVLAVGKAYQVQVTRSLTAELNAVSERNDALNNDWLELLARKQQLERQGLVRQAATERLGMVQPKTEAEIVVTLSR